MMLDFIMDIVGLFLRWILHSVIALSAICLFMYLFMWEVARRFGCRNFFVEYMKLVIDWIRDAFRD